METKNSVTVENKDLINSLMFMRQRNLMRDSKSNITFESVKEAEESAKEDVSFTVKESLNNLKQDISFLQKKGYELKLDGIKLLEVPLKLKVWKSNYYRKDLENIYTIIDSVSVIVEKLKKEQEEKEKNAERMEKIKEKEYKEEKEGKREMIKKVV